MKSNGKRRWALGATLTALALVPPLAVSSTSSASVTYRATPAAQSPLQLAASTPNSKLLSEGRLAGGDYAESWQIGKLTVTAAAPAGSTVTVIGSSRGFATASVTLPVTANGSDRAVAAAYRSGAKSIEQDAIAVGYTPSEARKLYKARPDTTILSTPCVSLTADSKKIHARSCDEHELAQKQRNGHWILADELEGTATSVDIVGELYTFAAYITYPKHNSIFEWRPNSTQSIGDCKTVTESIGWNGIGYSSTSTVCPDTLSPYDATTGTKFGAEWDGCEFGAAGVNSVDLDNNPTRATDEVRVTVKVWWKSCIL